MLDLPGHPILDKANLLGACLRLPLQVDAARLRDEVASLGSLWDGTGGRVGVHSAAQAIFLRGHAPAEGELPIEDRAPLAQLPYVRWIIQTLIPAPALRCLLARLPAQTAIPPHVDQPAYFSKSIRIHVPVTTNEATRMISAGQGYVMREGEVWALNNSALHAVWNGHSTLSRTHLICDFLPTPELLSLLARSERHLGSPVER